MLTRQIRFDRGASIGYVFHGGVAGDSHELTSHFLLSFNESGPRPSRGKMPQAIGNSSPEEIIQAIEANLIDSSIALGRTEEGVVFRGSDVTWVYTGYRALSRVMCARFSPEEAEDRVAEIAECFRQWDAPVLWVVGPSTWPPKLGEYLAESGFGNSEAWMGTAVDLSALPKIPLHDSLKIELITEKDQLEAWVNLSTDPWSGDAAEGALSIFSPENAGSDPRCRYYLAYLNNKPVARGMACVRGETVGLYWLATSPDQNNSGHDLALAYRALTDAREQGSKLGVMPVHNLTNPVCQRLGFKPYCQFNVYAWPASPLRMPVC